MPIEKSNYFILTGAMGGGKSTVIRSLEQKNIKCIPEPAREILTEQRLISATGVPEEDSDLFTQLMLSRATSYYKNNRDFQSNCIIYDRGIPDLIAYAELFGLDTGIYYKAAKQYTYNPIVFFFKGWQDIYCTDEERKMTYQQASDFGERVCDIYNELGYQTIEIPKVSSSDRALFIVNTIQNGGPNE
ncbi:AAA family ATPase [Spirochaeta cellobiosiphila]|uniref:AAA family ATPase n=1 Tax=Spirochaeta cellobiosiphila TaxID=504483 RepID=UPI0003F75CCE|nr:AAA family ATPase [Spirochaeta cellobiosiphila]